MYMYILVMLLNLDETLKDWVPLCRIAWRMGFGKPSEWKTRLPTGVITRVLNIDISTEPLIQLRHKARKISNPEPRGSVD